MYSVTLLFPILMIIISIWFKTDLNWYRHQFYKCGCTIRHRLKCVHYLYSTLAIWAHILKIMLVLHNTLLNLIMACYNPLLMSLGCFHSDRTFKSRFWKKVRPWGATDTQQAHTEPPPCCPVTQQRSQQGSWSECEVIPSGQKRACQ